MAPQHQELVRRLRPLPLYSDVQKRARFALRDERLLSALRAEEDREDR